MELFDLSFNLFVAGEMEIITRKGIKKAERNMRCEVLKMLAYAKRDLSTRVVLEQYSGL